MEVVARGEAVRHELELVLEHAAVRGRAQEDESLPRRRAYEHVACPAHEQSKETTTFQCLAFASGLPNPVPTTFTATSNLSPGARPLTSKLQVWPGKTSPAGGLPVARSMNETLMSFGFGGTPCGKTSFVDAANPSGTAYTGNGFVTSQRLPGASVSAVSNRLCAFFLCTSAAATCASAVFSPAFVFCLSSAAA